MSTPSTEKKQKQAPNFSCTFCYYNTCKRTNFASHLLTAKHQKRSNGNILSTNSAENQPKKAVFTCENCDKTYKERTGLWKHEKKCLMKNEMEESVVGVSGSGPVSTECVLELLKQNKELQNTIVEQSKTIMELVNKPVNITNNNCNNNNKFNINFFLHEQCKNAMNITDFVDSLKLTLQDLEKTGEIGYVKGITNIIVNGLNELDVYKRPIHCSDIKRETLYVKDNDIWEKENNDKAKIKRMIKHVSYKNAKQVGAWTKENKGYNISTNKKSDKYLKIVSEANSGEDDEINKIISGITPKITINKDKKNIEESE